MATSSECIEQLVAAALRPVTSSRPAGSRAQKSIRAFRQQVRSGLAEFVEMRPGESAITVLKAGSGQTADTTFDVVLADCGLGHEGEPAEVARDLLMACRPGGRIGLSCPVPGSFLATILDRIAAYTAGSSGSGQRGFTGTRRALNGLFEQDAVAMGARDRSVTLRFSSVEHWLAEWRTSFAPLKEAYERIQPEWRSQFTEDLLKIAASFALPAAGQLAMRCDYIEFMVHKADH
jgi:SAM-dependent methyltransferase